MAKTSKSASTGEMSPAKKAWLTMKAKYGPTGRKAAAPPAPPKVKKVMPKHEPIKLPKPKPASAQEMAGRTLVFILTFRGIGNRRKVDTSNITIDADKEWIGVSKKLIDAPQLKAISSLDGEARRYAESLALPSTIKKGVYLMPTSLVEQVDEKLASYVTRRKVLVNELIVGYAELISEAKTRLKNLFNQSDYPTPDFLKNAFQLNWRFVSVNPPDRTMASEKIFAKEMQKAEAEWAKTREMIQQALRANLAEMVDHLSQKLASTDGKKKVFKENSIAKLTDFLGTFDARNITNDVQLKVLVDKAKLLLRDTDAETLRNDEDIRDYVAGGFESIKKALEPMIINKPIRAIHLEEE